VPLLTAVQLRRKRRDRAWFLWLQRSEKYRKRLESMLRKYFSVERRRVIAALKHGAFTASLADPLADVSLPDLERRLQLEIEDNNNDWESVLLLLLLATAAGFTSSTAFELEFEPDDIDETIPQDGSVPIPVETNNWTRQFIEAALLLIAATSLKRIISVIADAQQKKQSLPATITRINEAYEKFIRNRAPGIASDLVGKVASMAQQIAILKLPVPIDEIRQTWVSMRDAKVRDSHQDLDGETRKFNEEFRPGLKFPRDPNAPIEETINCRCWLMIERAKKARPKAA